VKVKPGMAFKKIFEAAEVSGQLESHYFYGPTRLVVETI
jgi:hypothetical protein